MQEIDNKPDAPDEEEGKATPRFRVDAAHDPPPTPHLYTLPAPADIRRLALWLERDDVTMNEFGEKLGRYSGLSRYVIAHANWTTRNRDHNIHSPTHAAAFLGSRRLQNLLQPLAAEGES
ncbi:MAG: hypothetical protein KDA89_21470 [Planctomycetaceae bacterium]|nr:hypothetical protein [Planctomycetaceae bacterium]